MPQRQFSQLNSQPLPKANKIKNDKLTEFNKIVAIDGTDVISLKGHKDNILNVVSIFDVGNNITIDTEMGLGKGQ